MGINDKFMKAYNAFKNGEISEDELLALSPIWENRARNVQLAFDPIEQSHKHRILAFCLNGTV